MTDAAVDIWDCVDDLLAQTSGANGGSVVGLPSAKEARSLIVISNGRAAARLARRQFGGKGWRRSLQTNTIALLLATGVAVRIPGLRRPPRRTASSLGYRAWLDDAWGGPAQIGAILLGPPRANRKPVVLLTAPDGELQAVAKFGVNDVTRPLVAHEALALDQVGKGLRGVVYTPRLVASGAVGDAHALIMEALPKTVAGRRPPREALVELVRSISSIDQRKGPELPTAAAHPRLAPLGRRIEAIAAQTAGVQVGSFHGDLHPGNLGLAADGQLVLWDWERWGYGVPVGFDLLHHDLQSSITREGVPPREAAARLVVEAPVTLAPLGVAASQAPAVALDYLVRLAARYATDAQDKAGSMLGAIESWMFPVILDEEDVR